MEVRPEGQHEADGLVPPEAGHLGQVAAEVRRRVEGAEVDAPLVDVVVDGLDGEVREARVLRRGERGMLGLLSEEGAAGWKEEGK